MDDEQRREWLANIKAGDELVNLDSYVYSKEDRVRRVTKVTAKRIYLDGKRYPSFIDRDGTSGAWYIGSQWWPNDPVIIYNLMLDKARKEHIDGIAKRVNESLSDEQVARIEAILEEPENANH